MSTIKGTKDSPIDTVEDTEDQEKFYDVDHIIEKGNADTQIRSVPKKMNVNELQNWLDRIET